MPYEKHGGTIPTGMRGKSTKSPPDQRLDDITGSDSQKAATLVSGGLDSGRLFLHGIYCRGIRYGDLASFGWREDDDLKMNFRSMGFDLDDLVSGKKLILDHITIDRSEIEETGEYDLEGLFIRLGALIDEVGAKRIAIDTLEALFSGFAYEAILRSELRRLFLWLKDRGVTAIVTGERGDMTITKYGLEEYVADCVITLDHRVTNQIATRRLHIVKYRGSIHGTDEYPFLISEDGTRFSHHLDSLTHTASNDRSLPSSPARHYLVGKVSTADRPSLSRTGRDRQDQPCGKVIDAACRKRQVPFFIPKIREPDYANRNPLANLEPGLKLAS